jgi:hypothetical protein
MTSPTDIDLLNDVQNGNSRSPALELYVMKAEGEKKSVVTWHTVTWEKGKDGVWKIALWHASK